MAGLSPRKAKAARRLVTGSGRAKDVRGIPVPRSSGKPLSVSESKKVAVGDVKRSATRLKNSDNNIFSKDRNLGVAFDMRKRSTAPKKMTDSLNKAKSTGVSSKAASKAVDKGFKIASKRKNKDLKATKKAESKNTSWSKVENKVK